MKKLPRIRFSSYIMLFINDKTSENEEGMIEFEVSYIENRNPEQVSDELWEELLANHFLYEDFS